MTNQGKPNRIMLVEDNRADVYLVQQALNHHQIPHELICYEDGKEAITGLENCIVPDVIILDLNLPRLGGFEVLQAIRGEPKATWRGGGHSHLVHWTAGPESSRTHGSGAVHSQTNSPPGVFGWSGEGSCGDACEEMTVQHQPLCVRRREAAVKKSRTRRP